MITVFVAGLAPDPSSRRNLSNAFCHALLVLKDHIIVIVASSPGRVAERGK